MAEGPLVKVRTGPSSYLKMTEADAKAYRARYGEYGVDSEPETEPDPKPRRKAAAKKDDT